MKERLQKIISHGGIASRRKAEELILEGRVTVNGRIVTELGTRADPRQDHIKVDGKLIRPEPLEYHALHKPRGVLSSVSDPQRRPVVTDYVRSSRRLYPAGRLDFQSEGLMILTNDGELTRKLTEGGKVEKVYQVKVHGQASEDQLDKLRKGFRLEGVKLAPSTIKLLKEGNNCWYEVGLRQGKNRQIRNMFEHIGHPVLRIRRTAIGPVSLAGLRPGASRKLSPQEIQRLKKP
ncbi:MAG: pseudouridine synthase [Acidobacteriota bacterium]